MLNQKGFTVAHIFILGAVLLTALIIMDNTSHSSNPSPIDNLQSSSTQPTVVQTNPTPESTYTPIVSPSSVPTDIPVTHDGSKTGNIIDHYDWVTGKNISVYENELLLYTIKGKQMYLTQSDIDWYEKMTNITSTAQASINKANAEIDRIKNLNDRYDIDRYNNSNSGYTPTNYQTTSQQTYEPYTYTAPTTSPSNNTTTSIPTYPSAINKPADNGFNTTINDGTQAHLTPNSAGTGYIIKQSNGATWTGNCYKVGTGYYTCGN